MLLRADQVWSWQDKGIHTPSQSLGLLWPSCLLLLEGVLLLCHTLILEERDAIGASRRRRSKIILRVRSDKVDISPATPAHSPCRGCKLPNSN